MKCPDDECIAYGACGRPRDCKARPTNERERERVAVMVRSERVMRNPPCVLALVRYCGPSLDKPCARCRRARATILVTLANMREQTNMQEDET